MRHTDRSTKGQPQLFILMVSPVDMDISHIYETAYSYSLINFNRSSLYPFLTYPKMTKARHNVKSQIQAIVETQSDVEDMSVM